MRKIKETIVDFIDTLLHLRDDWETRKVERKIKELAEERYADSDKRGLWKISR